MKHGCLHLSRPPPEKKHDRAILLVQDPDGRISKLFPADPSVGIGLMCTYSQHCVQKKHALLCPFFQITVVWDITSHIILKFLINIHQRWRCFHTFFYGKAKPMSLSVIVIGVLSQDHNLYLMQRRKMKRIEHIFRRRKNLSCSVFCHHGFIKFGIVGLMSPAIGAISFTSHPTYLLTEIPFSAR